MSNKQYYLKDKKVEFYKYEERKELGVIIKEWVKAYPSSVWAYYRNEGGSKTLEDIGVLVPNATEDSIFVVNRMSDLEITTDMKLKYNGKYYDIVHIDDYEGYNEDLKLKCKYNTTDGLNK